MSLQSYNLRELIQSYIYSENTENSTFKGLYEFHQGLSAFRSSVLVACAKHVEFWKELQ